jgi:hypothetical protein
VALVCLLAAALAVRGRPAASAWGHATGTRRNFRQWSAFSPNRGRPEDGDAESRGPKAGSGNAYWQKAQTYADAHSHAYTRTNAGTHSSAHAAASSAAGHIPGWHVDRGSHELLFE